MMLSKDPDAAASKGANKLLDPFPGEDPLRHSAVKFKKSMDTKLATAGLLGVAQGERPMAAQKTIDWEMPPSLPESHHDFERRQEARILQQDHRAINRPHVTSATPNRLRPPTILRTLHTLS